MTSTPVCAMRYTVNRMTVETGSAPAEFQSRYEQAVPLYPADRVNELVRQRAPWQEQLDLMTAVAPLGFCIFYKLDVDPVVRLAG